jgi:hypothetical protein
MNITFTPNKFSNTTGDADVTFDQLHGLFMKRLEYDGLKEGNIMFIMGELKADIPQGGSINRCDENVISMSALVFDIDNKAQLPTVTDPYKFAADLGHKCLLASSASSTRDFPRARIIMPATRPMAPDVEYRRIQSELYGAFSKDHPSLDKGMIVPSQAYYFPQQPRDKVNGLCFVQVFDGPLFDPDEYLKRLPPAREKIAPVKPKRAFEPLTLDQALEALAYFDAGNDTDRFMTCLVFTKEFPFAESAWNAWHIAGSTKSHERKKFWSNEVKLNRGQKYAGVNTGWLVKEAKKRGWQGVRR